MFFFAAPYLLAGVLLHLVSGVSANTEIVNFAAVESVALSPALVALTADWTTLSADDPEKLWRIQPAPLGTPFADVCPGLPGGSEGSEESCPHEHWLTLRLDDPAWSTYSRFTLRISWPASSPADFDIKVKSAEALFSERPEDARGSDVGIHARTRIMYARVRVVDAGVRTPTADGSHEHATPEPISFIIILEPLYFGVLPASVLPTVAFLVVVIIIAAYWVVPPAKRYLGAVADEVRKEVVVKRAKSD